MELGRVHLGDCLTLLGNLEAESVDLVFCDPPYGVTANAWDTQILLVGQAPSRSAGKERAFDGPSGRRLAKLAGIEFEELFE